MRTQKLMVLDFRACVDVCFRCGCIANIEGAMPPHGVHHDGELARDGDRRFAMAAALGQLQASAFDLVLALEARQQS